MDDPNRLPLNDYASRLIKHKAGQLVGRYGFTRSDRADIEQGLIARLLEHMSKYGSFRTGDRKYLKHVINQKVASIVRHRKAARRDYRRVEFSLNDPAVDEHGAPTDRGLTLPSDADHRLPHDSGHVRAVQDLCLDLDGLLDGLDPKLRAICELLMAYSISETARSMGVSRGVVYAAISKLRRHLRDAGLNKYLATEDDTSSTDRVYK